MKFDRYVDRGRLFDDSDYALDEVDDKTIEDWKNLREIVSAMDLLVCYSTVFNMSHRLLPVSITTVRSLAHSIGGASALSGKMASRWMCVTLVQPAFWQ